MDKSLYTRPNKPARLVVTRRERIEPLTAEAVPEPIEVDRATECHVTPPSVAARMVRYLNASPDMLTLEPSAGTGNLVQALFDSGHSSMELVAIERHLGLGLSWGGRFKDIALLRLCFLEYAERNKGKVEFPRIIMNPPFRKAEQHVKAALSLLHPGGHNDAVLVALVPVTFEHPDAETLETLPPDTFAAAKVYTKIVRFVFDATLNRKD